MSARRLIERLSTERVKLVVAESLTGGALAAELVSVPGASEVFLGAVVAYDSAMKVSMLQVSAELLERVGPVSLEVATQMAVGARQVAMSAMPTGQEILSIATTGVAGPTEQRQPVGKVFIAVAFGHQLLCFEHDFEGDREQIRQSTVNQALDHALDLFD